nr:MAG TPA: hypothetical protein [Caudoviricetes sp.]
MPALFPCPHHLFFILFFNYNILLEILQYI